MVESAGQNQSPRPDLAGLAARYAFGIAKNHPFVDGKQRTALVVCRMFLRRNGFDVDAPGGDVYRTFMALAEGKLAEETLADWIRGNLQCVPTSPQGTG